MRRLTSLLYPFRWCGDLIHYWIFKLKQARAQRKSEQDDPNIYPLW
jgi:hypothetical protein